MLLLLLLLTFAASIILLPVSSSSRDTGLSPPTAPAKEPARRALTDAARRDTADGWCALLLLVLLDSGASTVWKSILQASKPLQKTHQTKA